MAEVRFQRGARIERGVRKLELSRNEVKVRKDETSAAQTRDPASTNLFRALKGLPWGWRGELEERAAVRVAKRGETIEQATAAIMDQDPDLRRAYAEERGKLRDPAPHPVVAKLRKVREEQGKTQVQVARAAGMDQGAVSRFESSPRPSWDSVSRYAEALELTHGDLAELEIL